MSTKNKAVQHVIDTYSRWGFNLEGHSFKALEGNQVQCTFRTYHRVGQDTINVFSNPVINYGGKIHSSTVRNKKPIWQHSIIYKGMLEDSQGKRIPQGTLILVITLPVYMRDSDIQFWGI